MVSKTPRSRAASGFTLIELLVVIAIIAILASILFPVFAQAREKARGVTCVSNTKQLVLGSLQYIQDYDETWPLGSFRRSDGTWTTSSISTPTSVFGFSEQNNAFWSNSMQPYMKSTQLMNCPSATKSRSAVYGVSLDAAHGYTYSITYNGYLNQWPLAGSNSPAKVIAFSEGLGKATMPRYANVFPLLYSISGYEPLFILDDGGAHCAFGAMYYFEYDTTWWVHNNGSNYAYADGHAKYVINPSASSPWATTSNTGLPLTYWVDAVASSHGCNGFLLYTPTIDQ